MVEQDQHFCDNAREFIGPDSSRVSNIFCTGLQSFSPAEKTYDLIWSQWVLGHLEDDDLITFFKKCQNGLRDGGVFILKENILECGRKTLDDCDSSYTRTKEDMRQCIRKAGLTIIAEQKQKDFPKDLYPVYMFAVQ